GCATVSQELRSLTGEETSSWIEEQASFADRKEDRRQDREARRAKRRRNGPARRPRDVPHPSVGLPRAAAEQLRKRRSRVARCRVGRDRGGPLARCRDGLPSTTEASRSLHEPAGAPRAPSSSRTSADSRSAEKLSCSPSTFSSPTDERPSRSAHGARPRGGQDIVGLSKNPRRLPRSMEAGSAEGFRKTASRAATRSRNPAIRTSGSGSFPSPCGPCARWPLVGGAPRSPA